MAESANMSEQDITYALYLYPVGNALATLITGLVSDKFGRKTTIIAMGTGSLVCYSLFIASSMLSWTPFLTGFLIGGFMGCYWGAGDTIGSIMFSESAPTNLRSSVTVINTLLNGIIGGVASIIMMVVVPLIPVETFGYFYLCLTVPGLIGAIIVMLKCVGETKGLDLTKVTGLEWDTKKEEKKDE